MSLCGLNVVDLWPVPCTEYWVSGDQLFALVSVTMSCSQFIYLYIINLVLTNNISDL